jgi:hypothetical protein
MSPLSPTYDGLRKKPKLEEGRVDSGTSLSQYLARSEKNNTLDGKSEGSVAVGRVGPESRVIPDTPEAQQPRIFSDTISFAQPTTFVSSLPSTLFQPTATTGQRSKPKDRTGQPLQRKKSPSPPPSALTWQNSEITGHLVDPRTDPDDDGTGLNGIGFRPTPAIAQARALRRRQQVLDWKAREAREARAKRSERRRRGVGGAASREVTVDREVPPLDLNTNRRIVKFAM